MRSFRDCCASACDKLLELSLGEEGVDQPLDDRLVFLGQPLDFLELLEELEVLELALWESSLEPPTRYSTLTSSAEARRSSAAASRAAALPSHYPRT